MATPYQQVKEFHQAFGHPAPATPQGLDPETLSLRLRLIIEEVGELIEASVQKSRLRDLMMARIQDIQNLVNFIDLEDLSTDLVGQFDALCDIIYVAEGYGVAAGLPMDAGHAEVHASNMSKLGEDGRPIYRDDGKVMKGPDYFPPELGDLL